MKKVYALNPVNFNHKKGEGMKGRRRTLSSIVTSIAAQEGGITACHLVLIIENGRFSKDGNGKV